MSRPEAKRAAFARLKPLREASHADVTQHTMERGKGEGLPKHRFRSVISGRQTH